MSIKFNPLGVEGLDISGSSASVGIGATLNGAAGESVLITDTDGKLAEVTLSNGQLLIGSTGNEPVAGTIAGTTNRIIVTNGAGTITLSTPQDLGISSNVQFGSLNTNTIDADGTLTIGAIDADIINIGNPASVVNLQGDVNIINTTNLDVTNSLIKVNVGGPVASGAGSGVEVEEDSVIEGYLKVSADRASWQLKSPARVGTLNIQPPVVGNLTINQELFDSKYEASNPSGFETPAQLDARDTANRSRSNHTGTQLSTTISDFTEAAQDAIGAALDAGAHDGIDITYDDVGNAYIFENTDKGSVAVSTHELAVDPHPQYETSAEAQAKVDAHANLTNNPHSVTKAQVGLGAVDNTSDLDKPISVATQGALDLKVDIASLGDLALLDTVGSAQIDNNSVDNAKLTDMTADTIKGRLSSSGDPQDLSVAQVITLLDVETSTQLNSRDTANRSRSNHTGTQLASTISDFNASADLRVALHGDLTNNPHNVTKAQVGLSNVDNTSDLDKPISTATQDALDLKYDASNPAGYQTASQVASTVSTASTADRDRANHTGSQAISTITGLQDALDAKLESSDIADFETSTELNARDTANRDRSNHTGTQVASTISDFNAAADVRVALHGDLTNNPHNVTKAQVGLGNVDNTSDLDKPVSTATQAAIDAITMGAISPVSQSLVENASGVVISGVTLPPSVKAAELLATVQILADMDLYQTFKLLCVYDGSAWISYTETLGDESIVSFSVNGSNQLTYSSDSYTGFVSGTINVRGVTH